MPDRGLKSKWHAAAHDGTGMATRRVSALLCAAFSAILSRGSLFARKRENWLSEWCEWDAEV